MAAVAGIHSVIGRPGLNYIPTPVPEHARPDFGMIKSQYPTRPQQQPPNHQHNNSFDLDISLHTGPLTGLVFALLYILLLLLFKGDSIDLWPLLITGSIAIFSVAYIISSCVSNSA
jgi:hypothetical protein